jgi:hypothetical protein
VIVATYRLKLYPIAYHLLANLWHNIKLQSAIPKVYILTHRIEICPCGNATQYSPIGGNPIVCNTIYILSNLRHANAHESDDATVA